MTSFRQIEANRRNARKSTGPITEEGKQRSRCNAVRRGLTAETVIGALQDAEDYEAFEAAIIADYDARSAVERIHFANIDELGLPPGRERFTLTSGVCSGSLRAAREMERSVMKGRLRAMAIAVTVFYRPDQRWPYLNREKSSMISGRL
jgi:hypothetical protein